jgi:predicted transcriptional regulator
MKIPVNLSNIKLFECLSSQTRLQILEVLKDGQKNIGELAKIMNMSSAIMTRHISQLEECGLITTDTVPGKRGLQKLCNLSANEITLTFNENIQVQDMHVISIPIGQYSGYEVHPTCGLASTEKYIGVLDDPRYFSSPERVNASLLWFQYGWVEYQIPSYILNTKPLKSIEISLEICSEFPLYNDEWPSDIYFYLNDILLGIWLSPGDFGNKKGVYTPEWWKNSTQYGLLKTIRITDNCTMLDGIHFSNITIDDIPLENRKDSCFRISSPSDAAHPGGVNLFGKGFGNYDQNIEVRIEYK